MFESLLCANHQQHLVSLSLLSMLGMDYTNSILASGTWTEP